MIFRSEGFQGGVGQHEGMLVVVLPSGAVWVLENADVDIPGQSGWELKWKALPPVPGLPAARGTEVRPHDAPF